MPDTIRFPDATNSVEAPEIIGLALNTNTLLKGGHFYASLDPIRQSSIQPRSSPFIDLVVDFVADAPVVLGDGGTGLVALYGRITDTGTQDYFLGILGTTLTVGLMPQIALTQDAIGNLIGWSQIIQACSAFDHLAVGGLNGDIVTGGPLVTVKVRPLVMRSFPG